MSIDKYGENVFDYYDMNEPDNTPTCDDCGETFPCLCDWYADREEE